MKDITEAILNWYDENKRSLAWRDEVSPYRTLVSEVMLQQTRVEAVKPYFDRFMRSFPTVEALAAASQDQVLAHWSGLGYYSRARNLHHAARQIVALGEFPSTLSEIRKLKGVGEYITGAIGSIAFNIDTPAVDGNHHRVLSRIFRSKGERKDMWKLAETLLPKGRAGDFNQALMDIGSGICQAKTPKCENCPIATYCQAFLHQEVHDYPIKKKKKIVPTETYISLRSIQKDKILLGQRPSKGLYGGMMEPPMFCVSNVSDVSASVGADVFQKKLDISLENHRVVGFVEHVLTHKKMIVYILDAELVGEPKQAHYQALQAYRLDTIKELGISTLASKIIRFREASQQRLPFS